MHDFSFIGDSHSLTAGVRKTLTNTFLTLGGLWLVTAATSFASLGLSLTLGTVLCLFGLSLILLFATFKLRNNGWGLASVASFAAIQGLTLGPLVNHYLASRHGTQTVLGASLLTFGAMVACSLYVTASRRDFSSWRAGLFAGLIVLVLASLVGLFFPMPAIQLAISAVACILFVGFILYDISAVVTGRQTNYILAALSVYLDTLNLFINLLRLVGVVPADD